MNKGTSLIPSGKGEEIRVRKDLTLLKWFEIKNMLAPDVMHLP